jgi:hypothetical protein
MTKLEALIQLRDKVKAGQPWHFNEFDPYGALPGDWVSAFNGSLDAAKALHEAVLPGWVWCPEIGTDAPYEGWLSPPASADGFSVAATDPARAWLLAILEALISQETGT